MIARCNLIASKLTNQLGRHSAWGIWVTLFGAFSPMQWLALAGHELLLFAGFFFLIGTLDDLMVDLHYVWLRLIGKVRTQEVEREALTGQPLRGIAAVLIPTWQEAEVIGSTVSHALAAWPQEDLRIYVGCYRNDPATARAVMKGARGDPRARLVIHDRDGPTSKADCLNRLYAALCEDEARTGERMRMVMLHDAEDMVDAAALPLIDQAIGQYDFVQIPVLPEPQAQSRWIAGHYCDEFAEAHGKSMVVRCALGAGLPAAGVGCAFARSVLDRLALEHGLKAGVASPFASESLTEDYELGLKITVIGGKSTFLRVRGTDGKLVATRACFPTDIVAAVRQKTRWVHGIAFQGWERMGWSGRWSEQWMRLRDRRGPLAALVLAAAYAFFVIATLLWLLTLTDLIEMPAPSPLVRSILLLNICGFVFRVFWRCAFTLREYGWIEGLFAIPRMPVSNVVAIMAGRRALAAYLRSLKGEIPRWEKTDHRPHPTISTLQELTA